MKKIYTLLAAGAIVFTASAAVPSSRFSKEISSKLELSSKTDVVNKAHNPAVKHNISKSVSGKEIKKEIVAQKENKSSFMRQKKNGRLLSARKVDSANAIEGTWQFTFGDYYFQTSTLGSIKVDFTATLEDDNMIWFDEPTGYYVPFLGEYDAASSAIKFYTEYIGSVDGEDIIQQPFEYNWTTNELDNIEYLNGAYNASAGTLTFSADQGIAWEAWSADELDGYFDIFDFEGARLKGGNTGGGGTVAPGIEGTWIFTMGDYYLTNSTQSSIEVTYEATIEDGVVYFEDINERYPYFGALFDNTTNKLTIPASSLGFTGTYYVVQQPFEFNWDTGKTDNLEEIVGTYNESAGTLTFTADQGVAWEGYTDANFTNLAGYFAFFDFEGARKMTGGSGNEPGDDDSWKDLGKATFMDGWVVPAFGMNQADYLWEVPLQQSTTNENVYRLVDPYHQPDCPILNYNSSNEVGYILFDVTNPEHVYFPSSKAGFANSELGISTMYVYNALGWSVMILEETPEDIIEAFGEGFMPDTKFKDGIVDLGFLIEEDEEGNEVIWYDCMFGIQGLEDYGLCWQDENEEPINMCGKIYFPGVYEDSGVDTIAPAQEGEVRYYNLQGLEVKNPERGQIFIRVEGNKAVKVVK